MKKFILSFALIATLGLTTVSCSTDDSALETSADNAITQPGPGDIALPRPTTPKP
ncbi:hypothetical protein OGH69_05045 [Flavobacterium sp. MFBS3-15]|uniref:hypothetical protein n=1 Tax=Flavobacterium sp. MFBS3-15 TaxID=2989816 RepID=UPI0022360646|nr:hypothetical protein [Flavobacterium sp. MFBS3-15]MCW4468323.1 hypothetical protein [Flavobacterium sp. MFBS3-15]